MFVVKQIPARQVCSRTSDLCACSQCAAKCFVKINGPFRIIFTHILGCFFECFGRKTFQLMLKAVPASTVWVLVCLYFHTGVTIGGMLLVCAVSATLGATQRVPWNYVNSEWSSLSLDLFQTSRSEV